MKNKLFKFSAIGILGILLLSLILTGCDVGSRFDQPAITSATIELAQDTTTASPIIPGTTPEQTPGTTPGITPGTTPSQQQATGVPIRISIQTANFDMVNQVGDAEGDGYVIYYMDQIPQVIQQEAAISIPGIPEENNQNQQDGRRISTTATEFVWENVTPGLHIFSAQLVNAQGNPLSPPAVVAIATVVPQMEQQGQQNQPTP